MKSVAINALIGLLATSGAVDARHHRHHRRSCKASSSALSSAVASTATTAASSVASSASRTLTVTPLLSTLSVVPTAASSVVASSIASSAVASSAASSAAASTTASAASSASTPLSTDLSINALWKDRGHLYVGVATDENLLLKYPKESTVIKSEYGQVTPENSMKWDATEPALNQFDFSAADYLVNYAETNNYVIRGHTLVWHEQLPAYVANMTDKDLLKETMVNHITTIMTRYKGKIYAYDVLNEIFNYDGSMRETVFYNLLGEEYVSIAMNAARKADPNAKLYINEYGLDDPSAAKLVNGMVPKIKQWLAEGIPIDGIGSQSHLIGGDVSTVPAAIQALADTGIEELALTEMDISGAAAEDYVTVFNGCLNVTKCVGITVWGVSDADAWRSGAVLFDDNFDPKPAVAALKADLAA